MIAKGGVVDKNSLGVLSLKCEHALVKKQSLQLIRVTYDFLMKNNVSIGEGEHADKIFS